VTRDRRRRTNLRCEFRRCVSGFVRRIPTHGQGGHHPPPRDALGQWGLVGDGNPSDVTNPSLARAKSFRNARPAPRPQAQVSPRLGNSRTPFAGKHGWRAARLVPASGR
jgi:hypothetical protein